MNFFRKSVCLAARWRFAPIAGTAAFFALFGFLKPADGTRLFAGNGEQSATVTDVILRSTRYQMLHNDRDGLLNIIRIWQRAGHTTHPRCSTKTTDHALHEGRGVRPRGGQERRGLRCSAIRIDAALKAIERRPRARVHGEGEPMLGRDAGYLQLAGLLERRLPRAPGEPARAGGDRRAPFRWPSPPANAAASAYADVVSGRRHSFRCGSRCCSCGWWCYRPVKELIDGTHRVAGGDMG